MTLSLKLLGGFDARLYGEPITGFESNKVRALLVYLAVESDRAHRRKLIHGDVATALEAIYGEQRDRIAVRLAFHYGQSNDVEKAIDYTLQAGHQAQGSYAYNDAMHWYEEVLRLLAFAPSAMKADELRRAIAGSCPNV